MPTKKTIASAKRKATAARTEALDAARKRLGLETLATRNRDALDFHDLSVASIRDAIAIAFEIGFAAGAGVGFDAGFEGGGEAERLLRPVGRGKR